MVADRSPFVPAPPVDPGSAGAARSVRSRDQALDDARLVDRFKAGDEGAFVEIVTRYREKMFQVAFGLLRIRADAEEIAQDAFIRAHRSLARFRGDSSLATWLYRITLNLSRNRYWYFRRRRHHAMLPLEATLNASTSTTFAELVTCDAPGPVREIAQSEFATIIAGCMDRLPPGQREILRLRNVQQHSYTHIGRMLGIRVGTVKSRIARGRASLRLLLADACPEFGPDTGPATWFDPVRPSGRLELGRA